VELEFTPAAGHRKMPTAYPAKYIGVHGGGSLSREAGQAVPL
jgi:hypothetical protein